MPSSPLRVLLLEDTESDAARIKHLLRDAGDLVSDLTHARKVSELLDYLKAESFDLLLLDLCVPDSQGIKTFQRIHAEAPHLPIIVQSGLDEGEVGPAAVRGGAQDFLVKGAFDRHVLKRAIRYAVERKGAERALRESEDRYAAAVRGAHDGIWDWDLRNNRIYLSPRWSEILGYPPTERTVEPDEWMASVHPHDATRVTEAISDHLGGLTMHLEHEHRVMNQGGEVRWVLTRGLAARDDAGQLTRMAGSMSDITLRKRAEAQLRHDALHDALTGLPNRTLCIDRVGQAMRRARRSPGYTYAFLYIDVDRFKLVNDSLGHARGDELLKALARRLTALIRPGDTLVRLAGDEFGLLLEELSRVEDAEAVADRVQAALEKPFPITGQEIYVTASIGIALASADYDHPEDLIRDADLAMYQAKKEGKARYQLCDSQLLADARRRMQIETALRQALDRNEFELHYQPIVELATGRVCSFEGLIRWRNGGEPVPPGRFISVAEDTGLIVPIGAWVIREAARALSRWCPDGEASVSVNLSPKQFLQPDLVPYIARALRDTGLAPERLAVEITEGVFIHHSEPASRIFDELKALGVSIHLDDFGTGYSSLAYLRRFPVDCVKIDRSFLIDVERSDEQVEIIRAIVALGSTLGIRVIAEGIENVAQLELLRELGCEMGQGFLFSRAVVAPRSLPVRTFRPNPSSRVA